MISEELLLCLFAVLVHGVSHYREVKTVFVTLFLDSLLLVVSVRENDKR